MEKADKVRSGDMVGYKVKYEDNNTVWYSVVHSIEEKYDAENDLDHPGICFDFKEEQFESIKKLMVMLKKKEPFFQKRDLEFEAFQEKRKAEEETWCGKAKDFLEDIGITFTPFYWRFNCFLVTRPVCTPHKKEKCFMWCDGFHFGPFTVTW